MIPRKDYKKVILTENYKQGNKELSFADWVLREAYNDPGFFRWLFEDDNIGDFDCPNMADFETFTSEL